MLKISQLLKEAGISPKKSLGQNFLINETVYKKIVDALAVKPSDIIVEVGSGLGILADHLIAAGARIIAVEKDDRMVEYLQKKYKGKERIEIVHEDILKFSPKNWGLEVGNWKLAGNIPYYLTSRLFRIIFDSPSASGRSEWPPPEKIVFTIQKEVAQRIVAKPPDMSLLAVSVQCYSKPKIMSYVSRGSFYPMPNVDSAIIALESRIKNQESGEYNTNFFRTVKAGFSKKRKQLINNLAGGLGLAKTLVESKLKRAGIDPKRRAETLSLEEWERITKIMF